MRERKGCMLCYPFEEKRLYRWTKPWIGQPKLDGFRSTYSHATGLRSSTGLLITSLPELVKELNELDIKDTTLDGELYCHNTPFQDLCSIVKRTNSLHKDRHKIQFHVFDTKEDTSQLQRLNQLNDLTMPERIVLVPSIFMYSTHDIQDALSYYMGNNYEGIIIRNPLGLYKESRSTDIMKLKPTKTDTYPIVGFLEEYSIHGVPKEALGAFICMTDDSTFQVGTGLTREQRITYWKNKEELMNKSLTIQYQELTNNKIPRFPVAIKINY